ncbi:Ser/Thr protein kinase RdoA (MazF antagonist) [Angulomicrobium tetraedrale]|uniref:Ser/Thr protein kinase RdoA (MazF antagonist) n=1 Tax=Ancylobacter tetraedralis TaxID=217068 RepID=A0A839ZGR4_9HYPH|nr:phosphotransferase [Ancylobacter tetraedralis]MBB3773752.1 Ser/Thr protein kinase RdoA (MazF antagonist) [Ancylobacter tetraedralis]
MSDAGLEFTQDVLDGLIIHVRGLIPSYGFNADAEVALLNISENATFRIGSGHHQSILRVHRQNYHTFTEISSELAWMEDIRSSGIVEVPVALSDEHGTTIQTLPSHGGVPGRHAVMFSYLPGKAPSVEENLPHWFTVLGEVTARLHRHSMAWTPPKWFVRHVWDADAMHGARKLWGAWQSAIDLGNDGKAIIGLAVDKIRHELGEYGQSPDRFGLVHADLRLANLLIDGDRLKVIDFDDSGFSWHMYDFAAAVSFIEHLPNIPELRDAWLDGYSKKAPVTSQDRNIIPTMVMTRRILLMAWLASHREIPLSKEIGGLFTEQTVMLSELYLRDRYMTG